MLDLQEYIQLTRVEILKAQGSYGTGRKPDRLTMTKPKTSYLSVCTDRINQKHLFAPGICTQKTKPQITTARQIRQSVITAWLKTKNLRTVQYMAGHRYVSSTERYQENNLEDLYNQLEKLHPLSHP